MTTTILTKAMEHTILLVDDEKNILSALLRLLRRDGHNILIAEGGDEGLEIIKKNRVSAVVSDHRMPGMDGVEFLSRVKEASPDTIRFMLTGYADIKAVMAAINKGEVYRYITKPWNDDELRHNIREALNLCDLLAENKRLQEVTRRQNAELVALNSGLEAKVAEKTRKIRENFFAFVRIVADLMELYDQHVGGHSKRVSAMARSMALKMELDEADADLIEAAALLHNIGLIGIPREIIDKDEELLSEGEKALLRHNPVLSQDLLSSIDTLRQVGVIIRSQNERYDGRGYPDGLKRDEIHVGSMIIAVCRFYDGMVNGRIKTPFASAVERIKRERGLIFDPSVADAFFEFFSDVKKDDTKVAAAVCDIKGIHETVPVLTARPGMVLARNIQTRNGRLLVTKGTVLTAALISKVMKFNHIEPVDEELLVMKENSGTSGAV